MGDLGKGYGKKHGVNVDSVYLGGGARSMPALLGGSIQLFFGSDPASFVAAIQGAQMIKLGITMNTIGYYLMSPLDMGTIADLKGGGSSASGVICLTFSYRKS
jgi:ABC-type nitrate/sulfonate/bicarbonate transport system substrate-binding protein